MAVTATIALIALAMRYANQAGPGRLDRWIQASLVDRPAWAEPAALAIDFVGEPLGIMLFLGLSAAFCLVLGRRRLAVLVAMAPLLSGALTTALKPVIERTIHGHHLAYPSGHTAFATALAFVLALFLADHRRASRSTGVIGVLTTTAAAGLAMGWSQVYLSSHYPTDTLGGFCAALSTTWAIGRLIDLFAERHIERRHDGSHPIRTASHEPP